MKNTTYFALLIAAWAVVAIVIAYDYHSNQDTRRFQKFEREHTAMVQCVQNTAYDRSMLTDCLDDYYRLRGWTK